MINPQLILVRHGVTFDNQAGRLMGRNDAPLIDEAKMAARALGESADMKPYLDTAPIIWTSPLPRALETTRLLVADRNIAIRTADELIERDFGIYNGRLLDELWESDAAWKEAEGEYKTRPLHGESLADVELRVFPFLVQLHTEVDKKQHLILVGHSTVWRLVAAALHNRRMFPLQEKIAGPLSMQVYPRQSIELLFPILDELTN